jgi:catechol 2,3-dioxygenase-like lactoylglutathione lyase family enzyme
MNFETGEINIICAELDRSLTFYRDILGFVLVEREGIACRLKCADRYFLLLPVADSPRPREQYCSMPSISFDLLVDDIAKARKFLQEKKVEFDAEWKPDSTRFFIRDPDGLVIEVIQHDKP